MIRTNDTLGGHLLLKQVLPRLDRKVVGSFLLHHGICLVCYSRMVIQECRYELNSELMWAFSRVSQNRDIDV